ncbi:hypothetical protein Ddc_14229 [Ditylenchus destructor]|nr:hypothetical protein Ddc_14229 [Ditylenchus destructor]
MEQLRFSSILDAGSNSRGRKRLKECLCQTKRNRSDDFQHAPSFQLMFYGASVLLFNLDAGSKFCGRSGLKDVGVKSRGRSGLKERLGRTKRKYRDDVMVAPPFQLLVYGALVSSLHGLDPNLDWNGLTSGFVMDSAVLSKRKTSDRDTVSCSRCMTDHGPEIKQNSQCIQLLKRTKRVVFSDSRLVALLLNRAALFNANVTMTQSTRSPKSFAVPSVVKSAHPEKSSQMFSQTISFTPFVQLSKTAIRRCSMDLRCYDEEFDVILMDLAAAKKIKSYASLVLKDDKETKATKESRQKRTN